MGPDDLLFDGDSFLIEPLFPGGNEGFIDLKGHMHRSSRTMGRKSMVCLLCFPGIEQKEHPFTTVEKDMPLILLAIQLKTEEIRIKLLGLIEVIDIQACFQDSLD